MSTLSSGLGNCNKFPDLIEKVKSDSGQYTAVSLGRKNGSLEQIKRSHETFDPLRDPTMRPTPFQAYLRIQIGCDKFCTYCIVPMTRGPEQGRPPKEILDEAKILARSRLQGKSRWSGQTVNSYKHKDDSGTTRLSGLLQQLHEIEGLQRLKFVTNYPKDMTTDLLETIRDYPKISKYIHVPLQSGSNDVLKRMKRGYTVEDYRDMMARIHDTIPGVQQSPVTLSLDSAGETEEEFQETVKLTKECRFKNSFIFKYSERPGTKGAEVFPDDIPDEIKKRRNNEITCGSESN